ncbi:hypothetical protein [Pantoea eucalypti]|uniref:hypothetical protein n=1 Tax=Pantoea eucalypti TaxID=470933 RepID=UPI003FA41847
MINFCKDDNASYYRSDLTLSQALLTAFPGIAALTRSVMAVDWEEHAKTFSLDKRHYEFDFQEIENAFDCEFIEVPDNIASAKDFRKWIMEMNVE